MRHVERRAQDIADTVARPHRNAGRERTHRQPCADLRIHPRVEIPWVGLHPRQGVGEHGEALHRLCIRVRMGLTRADRLDTVVEGADAGREEQPFRRVHRDGGIEDGRARHRERMPQHLLHMSAEVGHARNRRELAAGNRGRHADLTHGWRGHLRRNALMHADALDAVDVVDAVGETELHGLGAVSDRAPANGDDQVGARLSRRMSGCDHRLARRVCGHGIEQPGAARAERLHDFCDLVGLTVQRARDHQEGATRPQPIHLADDGFSCRMAEHDLLNRAVNDTSLMHACPPGIICLVL